MYICNDDVCDPCCDFCWYCVHGKNGEPIMCIKKETSFCDGLGYCDGIKCRLHEQEPSDISTEIIK